MQPLSDRQIDAYLGVALFIAGLVLITIDHLPTQLAGLFGLVVGGWLFVWTERRP